MMKYLHEFGVSCFGDTGINICQGLSMSFKFLDIALYNKVIWKLTLFTDLIHTHKRCYLFSMTLLTYNADTYTNTVTHGGFKIKQKHNVQYKETQLVPSAV